MSRTPGVNAGIVLPPPPEKYDAADQRETRRLLEETLRKLTQWTAVDSVPAPVVALGAVAGAADMVPFFTGASAMALASLTPYARTILACATAANARTVLGLGPLAILALPLDATKYLNGNGAFASVLGTDLVLTDVTTNNTSTTKHGFAPKLSGDTAQFLNGAGAWAIPPGSGGGSPPNFPTITNLELRYSAKYSTVTRDTSGRVTNVSDLSGHARNSDTMTGTARPMYFQGAFNGQPCFGFDGANPPMHLSVNLGTTFPPPFTVVIVMYNYFGGTPSQHLYRDTLAGAVGFNNGGGAWTMYNGNIVSNAALYTQNTTIPFPMGRTAHTTVRIDQYDGVNSICANNAVEVSIGDPGTAQGGIHANLNIGSGFDTGTAGQGARMFLFEFLLFSRALTLAERNSLRAYYANPLIAGVDL